MLTEAQTHEILEGTWEELSHMREKFTGHRLRVVILPDEGPGPSPKMITRGMFPQLANLTEEDFKIAEFHADEDADSDASA